MMTHDELLAKIGYNTSPMKQMDALRAVVELHKPDEKNMYDQPACRECIDFPNGFDAFPLAYPCPTIQAIVKRLDEVM
jgi:hypothetical protein